MNNKVSVFCLFFALFFTAVISSAGSLYGEVSAEYPKDRYIIGIGETGKTDNFLVDKRVVEVLARLEIARQIKVRLREETIDIMCEGGSQRLFSDKHQCENEFIMTIETTVDESLKGSNIVSHWEENGVVYALAVMHKSEVVKGIEKNMQESIDKIKENIEKAKEGDRESVNKAREEYMKAITYDKEKALIEGVKSHASGAFEELENEIVRLHETK